MDFLDAVEQSADYVMAAGGLAAGEDYAHVDRLTCSGSSIFFESEFGQTISIGEELLNFLLVGNRLSRFAFNNFHSAGEHDRKFRLICCTCFLQRTFFHV